MIRRFLRPEFIYRPSQSFRAAWQKWQGDPSAPVVCRLPWGADLHVDVSDFVGRAVYRHGLTALEACEAAFRILEPGDFAIDAGANIGTVTSAMAACVGESGRVISIEMLPATFANLTNNVADWGTVANSVEVVNFAVSDRNGLVRVGLSDDFVVNSGVAYATHDTVPPTHRSFQIPCIRLDALISSDSPIKLLKLDVERHEYHALIGAGRLISDHIIENIVFEDHAGFDTPAKKLLQLKNYRIYSISANLRKPVIRPWQPGSNRAAIDTDNYGDFIATVDPDTLERRFVRAGYKCLA